MNRGGKSHCKGNRSRTRSSKDQLSPARHASRKRSFTLGRRASAKTRCVRPVTLQNRQKRQAVSGTSQLGVLYLGKCSHIRAETGIRSCWTIHFDTPRRQRADWRLLYQMLSECKRRCVPGFGESDTLAMMSADSRSPVVFLQASFLYRFSNMTNCPKG